jgi:tripartite-type tricarboxylate transporter receptor subunit TctC
LPDTPTLRESGFPDAAISSWVGFHAPAGTPPELVKRLSDAVREATEDQGVRGRLAGAGAQDAYLDSADFRDFLRNDLARGQRFAELRKEMTTQPH